MRQLALYARGEGGLPAEITETDICERFGWTFTELDNEDQDRVYTAVALANIRDCVSRIKQWLSSSGKSHIDERDLEIWGVIMKAEKQDAS